MKNTNEIEKALMQKVNAECREIVDKYFDIDVQVISDISIKIANLREKIIKRM